MTGRSEGRLHQIDVLVYVPSVELKEEGAAADEHLVFVAAVRAFAGEEGLVPAAARGNVANRDQRLRLNSD